MEEGEASGGEGTALPASAEAPALGRKGKRCRSRVHRRVVKAVARGGVVCPTAGAVIRLEAAMPGAPPPKSIFDGDSDSDSDEDSDEDADEDEDEDEGKGAAVVEEEQSRKSSDAAVECIGTGLTVNHRLHGTPRVESRVVRTKAV